VFQFLVKRFFAAIILVLFVTFITFAVMKINFTLPALDLTAKIPFTQIIIFELHSEKTLIQTGDPLADLKLNPTISEERIKEEAKRLGLDKSFIVQYFTWLGNVLQGELGLSQSNQKVIDLIKPALFNTLILNILAIFFTWLIAIPLGVVAAVNYKTWIDDTLRIITSIFMSVPGYVLAIFMLIFALNTGWFPIGGFTSSYFNELSLFGKAFDISRHLALPVFIMVIGGIVGIQRQMRANLLDVLQDNYILTAKAKGLKSSKIFFKHALRNAINPLVTILGYEFSALFAGSALIEMVLGYPGLGNLTLEAARKLDVNLVLANLLLGSIMLVLGNLLADLLLIYIDPRLRSKQIS
jgi:peptide/nickel transport system permease protein